MTNLPDDQQPLLPTRGRWFNDFSEARQGPDGTWIIKPPKIHAHRGKYSQFRYGCDHPSTWTSIRHLQLSLLCCLTSLVVGVDVDYPELFATTRTARLIVRDQAISTVGERYHVAVDWRKAPLVGEVGWPRGTPTRGAGSNSARLCP